MSENCGNCRFFSPGTMTPNADGECRRYPPTIGHNTASLSPDVSAAEWCGEWRGKEEESPGGNEWIACARCFLHAQRVGASLPDGWWNIGGEIVCGECKEKHQQIINARGVPIGTTHCFACSTCKTYCTYYAQTEDGAWMQAERAGWRGTKHCRVCPYCAEETSRPPVTPSDCAEEPEPVHCSRCNRRAERTSRSWLHMDGWRWMDDKPICPECLKAKCPATPAPPPVNWYIPVLRCKCGSTLILIDRADGGTMNFTCMTCWRYSHAGGVQDGSSWESVYNETRDKWNEQNRKQP